MPPDIVLLVLRIAAAAVLYAFLGVLLYFTVREVQVAGQAIHAVRSTPARLVVIEADSDIPLERGQEFRLQPVTTLGRGPTNTIILPDSFASTGHARIMLRGTQWWLEDLASRNGTRLNGVPITGLVVLSSDDVIDIGRVKLRFEAG